MVRAGDLTERITLERHDTESDSWLPLETLPTVWAEATSSGDQQFEFRIRYRNDLVDLEAAQPAMRLLYRGRVLELINVMESDRGVDLRLTARGHRVEVGDLGSTARRTTIWP
jgi:head-tail adaptor